MIPGESFDRNNEDSRTSLGRPVLRRDRGGPQSFEGQARSLRPGPPSPPVPGYGREPVGKGQAAAGFSAVRAPGIAAEDGRAAGAGAVVATRIAFFAGFLATFFAALAGFTAAGFFFLAAAFFFFAAFFFLPAGLAFFLAGFLAAFFFFAAFFLVAFFFAVFFAAFFLAFAMTSSYQVVAQKESGPNGPDYPTARPDGRAD